MAMATPAPFVFHQSNEQFRWGREKREHTRVDRGCILACAGGDVDTGLYERCYEKIGIDTDWWDLVGLAERPVSFDTSIFLWKKSTAQLHVLLFYCILSSLDGHFRCCFSA